MSSHLLVATPLFGHVSPVVTVGAALAERGHDVVVMTGAPFADLVRSHGLEFRSLPEDADPSLTRGPDRLRPRWASSVRDVVSIFVDPLAAQHRAVTAELERRPADVILGDTGFLGLQPMLLGLPLGIRPPIVGLSVTPISVVSLDAAPFGSALRTGVGPHFERRNRRTQWLLSRGPLRPLHRAVDAALHSCDVAAGSFDYFNQVLTFDQVFHLGSPELEYPRRELPDTVRMIGPVPTAVEADLPPWWDDLAGARHVVHVTQGTLANDDVRRLLVPAILGLADEPDLLVVVATGGRPVPELILALGDNLPANVRLADFLPYDRLFPGTSVLLTNGGYGAVQLAVRHGVPVVVAGSTEDKPEVAARVAWSGVGLDLRRGRPRPQRIRRAVRTVLEQAAYRDRAAAVRTAAEARPDPLALITTEIERLGLAVTDSQPERVVD
ncbi:MAG TPA: nucleotide disphospho-sugar-binding domain-containing protein [Microlunatus sp.]|nr:nucleotide disphospho-sugar-binding domain-containing protein [Microlunatus sp.]